MRWLRLALLCVLAASSPAQEAGRVAPPDDVASLVSEFADPRFAHAVWGVCIQSLATGDVWFEQDADRLLMPASNQKILTTAASLRHLGPDWRFTTTARHTGTIHDGVLDGDLVVRSDGDPTLYTRFHDDPRDVLRELARTLTAAGVERIAGDVIGDDDAFDDVHLGYGWTLENLPHWYAAEFGALQVNEGYVDLDLRADEDGVAIVPRLSSSYFTIRNEVRVGARSALEIRREPGSREIVVVGTLAAGGRAEAAASVPNPTHFYASVLAEVLAEQGIAVAGRARDIDELGEARPITESLPVLWSHRSPPLGDVLRVLMKRSQNLYAETMVRVLGREASGVGTFAAGHDVVARELAELGVTPESYAYRDGSGLSRYDLVTPRALIEVLVAMRREPTAAIWRDLFPIAGVDGSLARRMRGSAATGNVRAKTGTIAHVRGLSGYVTTADGEELVFSFLVNGHRRSTRETEEITDGVLAKLAAVDRRAGASGSAAALAPVTLPAGVSRRWLGPELWADRLQDWRLEDQRLVCVEPRRLDRRAVHVLTRRIARAGGFEVRVRTGLVAAAAPDAAAAILIGAGDGVLDPRAAALIHQWPGRGGGWLAGITADGRLFITDNGDPNGTVPGADPGPPGAPFTESLLRLRAAAAPDGGLRLTLERLAPADDVVEDRIERTIGSPCRGNVALVSHPGSTAPGGRFWFTDLQLGGAGVVHDPAASLGPVLSSQYTSSRGILKMTAQLFPVADEHPGRVALEIPDGEEWREIAAAAVVAPSYTATLRVAPWDATRDQPYRLVHRPTSGTPEGLPWSGTVRRDPADARTLTVAAFTGNHNNSHSIGGGWGRTPDAVPPNDWLSGLWFPHADLTARVAVHRPDLLFFSGDQVYEGKSPTFADRQHLELDYLYKWYLWCWAWRDLTRDIPAVTVPDDHDVYQGNVWGESGRPARRDHDGGYVHPASFVKLVERTQTSHLPDPVDPAPVEQGIGVYFTDLVWGRVGFAVLEDRKFKSGCHREEMPPTGTNRPDHVAAADVDVAALDRPGLVLLGDRQLRFLRSWSSDWRGVDMKAALSQTIFAGMATHHGPGLEYIRADLDSNGWPQTGRRRALEELRRAFAVHVGGDQHLATLIQHGLDRHGDAIWSFCVPSVANFYPRAWSPMQPGPYTWPPPSEYCGEHRDGLGNRVTVHAATNPGRPSGQPNRDLHDKMPGYGIVTFDKIDRTITFACWPRYADPATGAQYAGWPRTIHQLDNDGRDPTGWLAPVVAPGLQRPIVQVVNQVTGVPEYTLRMPGTRFRPPVYGVGPYTLRVSEDDGAARTWADLRGTLDVLDPINAGF